MKKYFLIISIILLQNLAAQSYVTSADSISIDQQLDSHFGVDYLIDDIIFVDSLELHFDRNREVIKDSYGTLDNSIVFMASIKDLTRNVKGVVGVYRNNQVIWYSDYITPDDEIYGGYRIQVIKDNNNDGKVEIMTEWGGTGGASYGTIRLFVHEWDGNQGVLVGKANCYDTQLFDYIDIQGDGIFEIIGFDYTDNKPTIYEWNGSEYTYSTIELDSVEMFFPRNNFMPIVNIIVKKTNGSYVYEYSVKNSESSPQSINKFDLFGNDILYKIEENYYSNVQTLSEKWYGDDRQNSIIWTGYPIKPGHRVDGFSYSAKGLPEIGYAYLRGYNYQWSGDYRENTSVKDFLNNSVIVKTIAAKLPPSPFISTDFVDTLTYYVNTALSLGWIQNEQTKNKYNTHFNTAKTLLQQGDSSAARSELQIVLNECNADSSSVITSEAYALLYFNTEYLVNKLPEAQQVEGLPVKLQDSQGNQLQADSLHYYEGGWQVATNNGDGTFTVQTERATISLKMFYLGGIQHKSNVPVGADTVVFQTINTTVQLKDSQNNFLSGDTVKYYAGGWKHFGIATNGTASKELLARNYTFKMFYSGSNKNIVQNTDSSSTVVFQTKNITVQLKDSQNNFLTGDTVKYYAGGWQHFGIATNGTVSKELLAKNYTFKMYYGGTNKNIVQNTDSSSTVVFQTVNTEVQLKDSQGNFLDGGTAEYYATGWKPFGTLTNGKANKELLSRAYTFKIHFAEGQNNIVQNLDSSTTVVFSTVNTTVQLKDSQNNLLDGGVVQYYAGGWLDFGTATNGVATKELLPKSYTFKMKYGGTDKNIVQDLATSTTITFNTVNTEIQLRDSQGNLLDGGFAKYYASGWKDFGSTTNGIANKELLSRAYTFKMQYGGADLNHVQNLDTNTTVVFNTISVTAQLKDSQGNLLDGGTVEYYAAGWKPFGVATNGTVEKELLAKSYTFKILYGGLNTTKVQDVSTNSTVGFATTLTTIKVKDNQNQAIENAEALYYGGGWKQIGNTNANGEVTKEILARNITFKAKQGTIQKNKQQDTSTNSVVEIILE